jgi:8-oxo-dGTP diphosphatase
MSYRAGIILLQDQKVALIERHRAGLHYYTFPGGHVDEGETPEQAAVREAEEELGLKVVIKLLVAEIWFHEQPQYYYLAETIGGVFGTGTGVEMHSPLPIRGTYTPTWMPLEELLTHNLLPRPLAEIVVNSQDAGWPATPPVIHE